MLILIISDYLFAYFTLLYFTLLYSIASAGLFGSWIAYATRKFYQINLSSAAVARRTTHGKQVINATNE